MYHPFVLLRRFRQGTPSLPLGSSFHFLMHPPFCFQVNAVLKRDTKELLAMKHMQKSAILAKGGKKNLDALWVERDLMCRVKSPFIVNLLYSFQNEKEIFFIMPFMRGGDLRSAFRSGFDISLRLVHIFALMLSSY